MADRCLSLTMTGPARRRRWRWAVPAAVGALVGTIVGAGPAPVGADPLPPVGQRLPVAACFVVEAHRVFLDRGPDRGEVDAHLAAGNVRGRLPGTLATSDEWLGVVVDQIYQDALDRPADVGGLDYWRNRFRAGALVNDIGALIYGSAEFYASSGGTHAGFITQLYQRILHRTAAPGDISYWTGQVAQRGTSRVARDFFASVESRRDRVDRLYHQILDRAPDTAGRDYWVGRLRTINDVALAISLAKSGEFYARTTATGCAVATNITASLTADSRGPLITPDGKWVVFTSDDRLVPDDELDGDGPWIYRRYLATGVTTVVSPDSAQLWRADGLSSSGAFVLAVDPYGSRVVRIDRLGNELEIFEDDGEREPRQAVMSPNGRYVVFTTAPAGTGGPTDLRVWDSQTGFISEVFADIALGEFAVSSNGDIAFTSQTPGLVPEDSVDNGFDAFVLELSYDTPILLTPGPADGRYIDISRDGEVVAFTAESDLLPGGSGDRDAFVRDLATDTTGRTAEDVGLGITISPDGTHVVFVRRGLERGGSAHRASVDGTEEHVLVTSETDHLAQLPFASVANQARRIVFQTPATDLTGDPDNGAFNIHVLDVATP